jgi:hypothetical protein
MSGTEPGHTVLDRYSCSLLKGRAREAWVPFTGGVERGPRLHSHRIPRADFVLRSPGDTRTAPETKIAGPPGDC